MTRTTTTRFAAPLMAEYISVPRTVMRDSRLSGGARMLYVELCDYAREKDTAFPSEETLAQHLGVSARQIRRYRSELEAMGLIVVERETRTAHNSYVIQPDYGPGLSPDDRTNPSGRERTQTSGATGHQCPPNEKQITKGSRSARETPEAIAPTQPVAGSDAPPAAGVADQPAEPPIASLLATLAPLVAAGRLDDPAIDGSDVALLVALQQHGEATVRAAVDHVAAWAVDTASPLRIRTLARLLPRALDRARRAVAADTAASDRPSWTDAQAALTAAVGRFGRDGQLEALRALAAEHPAAAALVVDVGWRAWCDTRHAGQAGRRWLDDAQRRYAALPLDGSAVAQQIALLEQRARQRAVLAAGEVPVYDERDAA